MSVNRARVSATLYGSVRHPPDSINYTVTAMFEFVVLYGTTVRSGKFPVTVVEPRNEGDFRDSVKDALVTELNTRYPGELFIRRDVMLFGL